MMRGKIVSLNTSRKKGTTKKQREKIVLLKNFGAKGDAHASSAWHRQVSLLDMESIETFNARPDNKKHPCMNVRDNEQKTYRVQPGDFAENITTKGLTLSELPIGARLRIGENAVLEITQIGKECHKGCVIRAMVGDCIMPRRGIFAKVVRGGKIKIGDAIQTKT